MRVRDVALNTGMTSKICRTGFLFKAGRRAAEIACNSATAIGTMMVTEQPLKIPTTLWAISAALLVLNERPSR